MYSVPKKVPEYRYPLYRSTGIRFKNVVLKGQIYNPSNNKNIQPVHEDSKFRTVDLERTELGTLRTCARVPRARAPRAPKKIHQPFKDIIYSGGFGDLDKYPALVLHYSGVLRVLRVLRFSA